MAPKFIRQELVLSVKCANFRRDDPGAEDGDEAFKKIRPKALLRDGHRCQYCGFKAGKYMEVHHKDDDHNNNTLDNLVTICQFCHNCQHIGFAGQMGEAKLIWLPEMEQYELNHMVRSIMVVKREYEKSKMSMGRQRPGMSMSSNDAIEKMAESANALFNFLQSRGAKAEQFIGTDSLISLGNTLETIARENPEIYDNRKNFLDGFRLLPLGQRNKNGVNQYDEIIDSWTSNENNMGYSGLSPRTWFSLISEIK